MKPVKLGIVGIGNMGRGHIHNLEGGKVRDVELTAVCDVDPTRLEGLDERYQRFSDARELIRSGLCEAVLVATPHYGHTTIGVAVLEAGLHLLSEKPISVHKADCEKLIRAYEQRPRKGQVFGAMFNQRTDPRYLKIKQLIEAGDLGAITRVNWIITDWFRTEHYYQSGGWRATWAGEGGGVLLNQCPHQLDLLQWLTGMPARVIAQVTLGKFHDIEVEDDVSALLTYPNGATGFFGTTTGEAPGTNRLEIAGDNGKLVADKEGLVFYRNEVAASAHSRTVASGFGKPDSWICRIPIQGHGGQHAEILQNFVHTIRRKARLLAPGVEGIHSVELANAMLLSGLTEKPVDLPLSSRAYQRKLQELIKSSKPRRKGRKGRKAKAARRAPADDFAQSF